MVNFIRLHYCSGEEFLLNAEKIVMIYPDRDNATIVLEANEECGLLYTKESYAKVRRKLLGIPEMNCRRGWIDET